MVAFFPSYGVFLAVMFYVGWKYLGSYESKKCDANWKAIRTRGKRHFVIVHYVLLRGAIISTAAIIYALGMASLWLLLLCVALPIMLIMVSAGNDEWCRRETDYIVQLAKNIQRIKSNTNVSESA